MTKASLQKMSVDQLVELFVAHAVEQDKALLWHKISKFNALYQRMEDIESELKSRPGDQRRSLLELFTHDNAQVRLKAAEATLAVAPEAARQMLESFANSRKYPQAVYARTMIRSLDSGRYTPA